MLEPQAPDPDPGPRTGCRSPLGCHDVRDVSPAALPLPDLSSRAWREEAMARAAAVETLSGGISGLPSDDKAVPEPAESCLAAAINGHVREALKVAGDEWPPMRWGALGSRLSTWPRNVAKRGP